MDRLQVCVDIPYLLVTITELFNQIDGKIVELKSQNSDSFAFKPKPKSQVYLKPVAI